MVQQQIDGPWQHMVGVIMLNLTGRKQVKKVLPNFLARWPNPESLLHATSRQIEKVIEPLGMKKVRAERLYRMSEQFLDWDGEDATELYGIGKYGSDSYRLFFKKELPLDVGDHELQRYVKEEFLPN
jgi:methyl-CpG-binding domain protein 4|tara:strand:+ start:224 stop:604 length:381 start_codon:yes stop_codon:yes gene_type:complete